MAPGDLKGWDSKSTGGESRNGFRDNGRGGGSSKGDEGLLE
jgi:hypothetical protein